MRDAWRNLRGATPRDLLDALRIAKPAIDPMRIGRAIGVDVAEMNPTDQHWSNEFVDGHLGFSEAGPFVRYRPQDHAGQRLTVARGLGVILGHPDTRDFAVDLLMPEAMVIAHAPYFDPTAMADIFGVTIPHMRRRLKRLGFDAGPEIDTPTPDLLGNE